MSRGLLIWLLVLPMAVLMGYMLATPTDFNSFAILLLGFAAISLPILLKSHHLLLAWTWNAALIVFFLPGQPQLGTVLAFTSLGIAIVTRTMSKEKRFISVPAVAIPIIFLTTVVLITAKLTGGIGARVFGAETWGAKRYLSVFGAVVGYFAFTSQRVPREKANLYLTAFFLGGLTLMISDLTFMAGPQFYFLYILFPSDYASMQAITSESLMRLSGIAFAAAWAFYFLLGRFGIEGVFDLRRPWRLILLTLCGAGTLLGGFRGLTILLFLVFITQFFVEGVYKKRVGPALIFATLIAVAATVALIDRLPLSVQRAFSFLPLENIDPAARLDAQGTLDWRLKMWKTVVPEIPKYLFIGKGYGFSGTDYYLTQEAVRRGYYNAYEDTLVTGNYHNGILTLLIPFGVFGLAAFVWFCGSSMWLLVRNFRYGAPALRATNTFLLAYFVARLLFYIVFYGQFDADFYHFTGIVGLSIALNGGVSSPGTYEVEQMQEEPELVPA
ncbi:MAG: O-antigen ligase family protein [Verrucomicrobiota bacterium]